MRLYKRLKRIDQNEKNYTLQSKQQYQKREFYT